MDPKYWTKYLELDIEGEGQFRRIRSTRDAMECLQNWPRMESAEYRNAYWLCRATLEENHPRAEAREAFVRAVTAAGMTIRVRPSVKRKHMAKARPPRSYSTH